jgi:membrane-associated phospholipid phosphatase
VRTLVAASLLAITLWPTVAWADDDTGLRWDESRPRFRPVEYVFTSVVGLTAIAEYTWIPAQSQPRWRGGILFDDSVRNALRVRSPSALRTVWTLADVTGVAETVIVVGLDSAIVPTLRGSFDTAWQLTWMDFQSYALGSIVTFTAYDGVGRTRPSYADCQHGSPDPDCSVSPTASFPSGHTAEAFIGAGLSCVHHAYVPIYGTRLLDALACVRDVGIATADGVLRIMGDRHYTTDVLAGAAIGFSFGYTLPWFLHYASLGGRGAPPIALAPMGGGDRVGVAASGIF